ncbi:pyridoxamine 5'-phosphate oxidase family protein [Paenibacillus ihbetae]
MKGATNFLRTQSLIICSTIDNDGKAWCSFLTGEPGFINVISEKELSVTSQPPTSDPIFRHLQDKPDIGLLAIDFFRRIRMRINGKGRLDGERLYVNTEQVYGNCPKYIQKRSLQPSGGYYRKERISTQGHHLSSKQQEWIRKADTFFIGSGNEEGKMDASHRGGLPGFVAVEDNRTLLFPDYFGNSMYNTLGNIYSNPATGLLFIDFDGGHSLQLSGRSEIIWDKMQISRFPGAERLVRYYIEDVVYIQNATPIMWEFLEYSPTSPSFSQET